MSFLAPLFIFINILWLIYLTYLIYRRNSTQNTTQPLSLDSIQSSLDTHEIRLAELNQSGQATFQKCGLYRFNPFEDTGGDQSFALALLDHHHDGVVITSLHTRDNTRIYAKPVKNGEGIGISLSKDEKLAILKAIKG